MMTETKSISEPKLAAPGAGLPSLEWAIAKYILLPRLFKTRGKSEALAYFAKESEKIMILSNKLNVPMLAQRRLIPRLRGLEDSSRYYSVAMTLQHLVIVNDSIRRVIKDLSGGGTKLVPKGTADFKPNPSVDPESILSSFDQMSQQFLQEAAAANIDAFPQATFPHPWFGPFNAHKWLVLAGSHQNIHRHQIEEIIAEL